MVVVLVIDRHLHFGEEVKPIPKRVPGEEALYPDMNVSTAIRSRVAKLMEVEWGEEKVWEWIPNDP